MSSSSLTRVEVLLGLITPGSSRRSILRQVWIGGGFSERVSVQQANDDYRDRHQAYRQSSRAFIALAKSAS